MEYSKEKSVAKANIAVATVLDRMFKSLMLICLIMHVIYLITFLYLGITMFVVLNIGSLFLYVYLYTHKFHLTPNKHYFSLVAEILLHMSLAVVFFGWDYGFQYFIIFLFTAIYIKVINRVKYLDIYSVFEIVLFVGLRIYTYFCEPVYVNVVPQFVTQIACILNIMIFFVGMFILAKAVNNSNLLYRTLLSKDNEELEELAQEDFLTGLSNRRSLYNQFEYMHYEAEGEFSCCVAIGDIDDFKQINDAFGHEIGDAILVQMSKIIKSMTRENDIVCRWGGEEIVIVMPNMPKDLAYVRLEKIRQKIAESSVKSNGDEVFTTITFGLYYHFGRCDLEQLVSKADQLLYMGKRNGKNQVVAE